MTLYIDLRNQMLAAFAVLLIAAPVAGQGTDALFAFPTQLELAVGETSTQPVVAVQRYEEGWVTDVTQDMIVTIADPSIVETVPVTYDDDGDLMNYVYLRGLAAGSTTATVSAWGMNSLISITVVGSRPAVTLNDTPMAIGSNLTDLAFASSELVFSDVFMTSLPWESSPMNDWGTFPQPLDVNPQGWVDSLLPGQVADTLMLYELDGHFPKGSYTLTWEGSGTIVVERVWSGEPFTRIDHPDLGNTHVAEIIVDATDTGGFRLRITSMTSPVRNIRLWMPEAESGVNPTNANTPPAHSFRTSYLDEMARYRTLRFGVWQLAMDGTDNQGVSWDDVTPVNYATQNQPYGASPEWAVRLINAINQRGGDPCTGEGVDPWIIVPYMADETYVRGLAELFATQIDFLAHPDIRIHVEWANEVWNPAFDHFAYARDLGLANNLGGPNDDPVTAAMAYQAMRSLEVFEGLRGGLQFAQPGAGRRGRACAASFPATAAFRGRTSCCSTSRALPPASTPLPSPPTSATRRRSRSTGPKTRCPPPRSSSTGSTIRPQPTILPRATSNSGSVRSP